MRIWSLLFLVLMGWSLGMSVMGEDTNKKWPSPTPKESKAAQKEVAERMKSDLKLVKKGHLTAQTVGERCLAQLNVAQSHVEKHAILQFSIELFYENGYARQALDAIDSGEKLFQDFGGLNYRVEMAEHAFEKLSYNNADATVETLHAVYERMLEKKEYEKCQQLDKVLQKKIAQLRKAKSYPQFKALQDYYKTKLKTNWCMGTNAINCNAWVPSRSRSRESS